MLFIARFHDKPGVAERRAELLKEHFAWLDANRNRVLLAGAVRSVDGEPLGGLWIIEGESKADVESVYQNDPFFANGLRSKVEIFQYVKANADRLVTI